jgi:hypothetical protein
MLLGRTRGSWVVPSSCDVWRMEKGRGKGGDRSLFLFKLNASLADNRLLKTAGSGEQADLPATRSPPEVAGSMDRQTLWP